VITDEDTGQVVGFLANRQGMYTSNRRYLSRQVSLMDGKYNGYFETHDECVAYLQGIEDAINQIAASKDQTEPRHYYEFTREPA
jgi:hypothetical protein